MSTTIFLKALGLLTQPNHLGNEPGSLLTASNVVIRRDNIIESRRGFKLYGTALGSSSDRAKQLTVYKERIIRHFASTLEFDTGEQNSLGENIFSAFDGSYSEVEAGLRIKFLESNGNLYFTTSDGIKKISASSASQFSTAPNYITDAGGIKALNTNARLNIELGDSSSFFTQDSVVAYRIVWGIKDRNNNLITGTPSERVEIFNPMIDLINMDYNNLLNVLDQVSLTTGSKYNDNDYVSSLGLPITATASQLRTNLISLASKLDQEEGILFSTAQITSATVAANVCTVTVAANIGIFGKVSAGDTIYLNGTWTGAGSEDLSGIQTVSGVTATTITFSVAATNGAVTLSGEEIQSGWFRDITEPAAPIGTVANHNELVAIQTYLENILIELQSNRNVRQVIDNDGSATTFPAELVSVTLGGAVATVVTSAPADARDILLNADLIYLNGTYSGATPSINGLQTVNGTAITATQFEFNSASVGVVTLGTDSTIDRILRFSDDVQAAYINGLNITTSATVILTITVPTDATLNHFYQVYRTQVTSAEGTDVLSDLSAGDEEQLAYEAYPTQEELDAGIIVVEDIVLDTFLGAFLYTNAINGEGILQANDLPPLAHDINRYKGYVFFANTQTRQRLVLSLLGITDLLSEYDAGRTPQLTVSGENGELSDTYSFVRGANEVTNITFTAETGVNYTSKYFTLNSANDYNQYYIWYEVSGVGSDPMVAGRTGVKVVITTGNTGTQIAAHTRDTLNSLNTVFSTANNGTATLAVTNIDDGYCTDATNGNLGATITVSLVTQGIGQKASREESAFVCTSGAGLAGKYFTLNTAYNRDQYYVWYLENGGGADPMVANKVGISVDVLTADTATIVAEKTAAVLNALDNKFICTTNVGTLTVQNYLYGPAIDATAATSGFTLSIVDQGALQVLLSDSVSPAEAVDQTARSLTDVINLNKTGVINAFYTSGVGDVPGKMLFEARDLSIGNFYFLMNGDAVAPVEVGDSFNPSLAPTNLITNISAADPTVITSNAHGLTNGDQIILSGTDSIPSVNGVFTITYIDANTFSIPAAVTNAGTEGGFTSLSDELNIVVSDNEEKSNRIYYSKFQQPESVPIVNYIDIGAQDQAILRIFPIRDSLMIFKQDGVYRLSGETAPFTVALFDSTCTLQCPDSVSATNNTIFAWTDVGIEAIDESGTVTMSRKIDVDILPKNNPNFVNFRTATWGVGYDSDSTYTVYTVKNHDDVYASIAYVYNTITESWTVYDKSDTCGIVNRVDDKLYLGCGLYNYIEQERKDFARTDYADRELRNQLSIGNYLGGKLYIPDDEINVSLSSVSDYKVGDVLTQTQYLTVYTYNMLLKKLDIDADIVDDNYFATLEAFAGDQLRNKIVDLANKLDADPGVNDTDYFFTIAPKSGTIVSNSAGNPSIISLKNLAFAPGDVNTGTDTITIASHGFTDGERVTFNTTGTLPAGLSDGVTYYIISSALNTFQVSLTSGGLAVDLTTTGTGTHTVYLSHNLLDGRVITISGSNSTPSINGVHQITKIDEATFSIPVNVVTPGTAGVYDTVNDSFLDIVSCYNGIIIKLNTDSGTAFSNYQLSEGTTTQECIITDINVNNSTITLNLSLPFVVGPLLIYESIITSFTYAPLHFGDPVGYKHLRETQIFFEDQTFTTATLSFGSDLLPKLNSVPVIGMGNGIFGFKQFGGGFFGGKGNAQPFRTFVPRNNQRCTYLTLQFTHRIAREKYSLYGISITGEVGLSTRTYR